MIPSGQNFLNAFETRIRLTKIPKNIHSLIVTNENWINAVKIVLAEYSPASLQITAKTFIQLVKFDWLNMSLNDVGMLCNVVPMISAKSYWEYVGEMAPLALYSELLQINESIAGAVNEAIKPIRKQVEKEEAEKIEHRREMDEARKELEK